MDGGADVALAEVESERAATLSGSQQFSWLPLNISYLARTLQSVYFFQSPAK